jgi:hypothetical protein
MGIPISNVTRRVVFAPSGTGPYAFTFEILAATDIEVYKGDTLLTLTTDYTVTINPNGTGEVNLVLSAGTDNITVVGARAIERTTDFVTGGDFFANTVNNEFDSLTIFAQQNAEGIERSIKIPVTDPVGTNTELPLAADRANKYLAFDSVGGLFAVTGTASTTPISAAMTPVVQAATLAAARTAMGVAIGVNVQAYDPNYAKINTAQTYSAKQIFVGSSSSVAAEFKNIIEDGAVEATAATGTINFDVLSQSVLYYTSDASGNWTLNVRGSSGTTINSLLDVGDSISIAFLVTNGGTAYYQSAFEIDGSSVTPKWQGGTAPTAGNINSIDSYTFVIVKTASATFTVFGSLTKFA